MSVSPRIVRKRTVTGPRPPTLCDSISAGKAQFPYLPVHRQSLLPRSGLPWRRRARQMVERLTHIHRVMTRAKHQVASRGSNATMLLVAPNIGSTILLPMVPLAPRLRRGYNVSISNVPGPQAQMYWNGARLENIYPVATAINGQALTVTMCSYADQVTFGYVSGRNVIPDIGSLIPLTERVLADLESAVGVAR